MNIVRKTVLVLIYILLTGVVLHGSSGDTRYDSNMNLPFNQKAGDVNPQTGNITKSFTDVSLPGRAGFNFSFGRTWSLNQSNLFNMYFDGGYNLLNSNTIEKLNKIGAGWSTTLPYIIKQNNGGSSYTTLNLFFGGSVYEIDQSGVRNNIANKSNIIDYDLTDIRVYEDGSVNYAMFDLDLLPEHLNPAVKLTLISLKTKYPSVTDNLTDNNFYSLVTKTNEKYHFRSDGKLMMQEDRSGLNRIWYFYSGSQLSLVVDTLGREIRFSYDANGNITSVTWDVLVGVKDNQGNRSRQVETRTVKYSYKNISSEFTRLGQFSSRVQNYIEPYMLTGVTDNMNNTTRYRYYLGESLFTYDSSSSHSTNLHLLLKDITSVYSNTKYRNKQCFEYQIPVKGMYTKYFYGGMMEYFKVSRQYLRSKGSESSSNLEGRVMNDTYYEYFDDGENGNHNSYSSKVIIDKISTTYTYLLGLTNSKNHVLDSIFMETEDRSVKEEIRFVYDDKRSKVEENTYRLDSHIYSEKFDYDEKGNLRSHIDKAGLETYISYDELYSIPLISIQKVTVEGVKKDYKSENKINNLGQVESEIIYLNEGGTRRPITVSIMTYDEYGNQIEQKVSDSNITYTVYDSNFNTFPEQIYNHVTIPVFKKDLEGNDLWQEDPISSDKVRIRSWKVFNTDGSIWMELDNEGYAIEHYYDKNGMEIETINPDEDDVKGFAKPISVDVNGNTSITDTTDFLTYSGLDAFLSSRINNPGVRLEIDYQNDFVKSISDINIESDPLTRAVISRDISESAKEGNGLESVIREIQYKNGAIHAEKKMEYDSFGRMVVVTDPDASESTGVTLNIDGKSYKRYDKSWVVYYDQLGRQKKIVYPIVDSLEAVKYIIYDDINNTIDTVLSPEQRRISEKYDWNGNLINIFRYGDDTIPSDQVERYRFEYDELKRKTKFIDAKGLITTYLYDERGFLLEQGYDSTGKDIMTYNDRGLLTSKTDRKNNRIDLIYDELGRKIRCDNYDNGVKKYSVVIDYDNRGNAVRINNGQLIEKYKFDSGNRITRLDRKLTDTAIMTMLKDSVWNQPSDIFSFKYKYNAAGMVTEMLHPDGSIHKYDYYKQFPQLSVINEGLSETGLATRTDLPTYKSFVGDLEYNKGGAVTSMNYENGTTQQWTFDNRKRISRTWVDGKDLNQSNKTIFDLNYTLNGAGDILKINNNEYGYDGFDRIIYARTQYPGTKDKRLLVADHFGTYEGVPSLTGKHYNLEADFNNDKRVNGDDLITASLESDGTIYDVEYFEYDKNGNRTKLIQNDTEYTYEYGERNRLLKVLFKDNQNVVPRVFAEYTYDANGNTVKRVIYTSEGKTKQVVFEYDTMNRVVKTTETDEAGVTTTTENIYDNSGNRLIKKTQSELTLYLRHGQIAVAMDLEVNLNTSEEAVGKINRYVLSGDLLAGRVTKEFKRDLTTRIINNPIISKYWYHLDHLNSTKAVTKEDGTIEVLYEYRAFGEQLKRLDAREVETDDKAKYSYGGKELDEETDLYYFNARYYDATIGRFINVDPIQDGTNWYVYCGNNPLNRVDPTGLEFIRDIPKQQADNNSMKMGHSNVVKGVINGQRNRLPQDFNGHEAFAHIPYLVIDMVYFVLDQSHKKTIDNTKSVITDIYFTELTSRLDEIGRNNGRVTAKELHEAIVDTNSYIHKLFPDPLKIGLFTVNIFSINPMDYDQVKDTYSLVSDKDYLVEYKNYVNYIKSLDTTGPRVLSQYEKFEKIRGETFTDPQGNSYTKHDMER